MMPVLDLDPVFRPASLIWAVTPLRDQGVVVARLDDALADLVMAEDIGPARLPGSAAVARQGGKRNRPAAIAAGNHSIFRQRHEGRSERTIPLPILKCILVKLLRKTIRGRVQVGQQWGQRKWQLST